METFEKIKNTLRALTLFALLAIMAFCLLCEPSADSKHWLADVVTSRMIGAVTAFGIWKLNRIWSTKEESA